MRREADVDGAVPRKKMNMNEARVFRQGWSREVMMKYDGSLDANCKRVDGQARLGLINELQKDSVAHGSS